MSKSLEFPHTAGLSANEYHPRLDGLLLSCSRAAPRLNPLDFLQAARGRARCFWRDGRSGTAFAGMGVAAELMGWGESRFDAIQRQARALFEHAVVTGDAHQAATPRLFGGFAFRDDFVPDVTWTGFNPGHFILPHIQFVHDGDSGWLTINALIDQGEDVAESASDLREALDAWYETLAGWSPEPAHVPTGADEVSYPLDVTAWTAMIEQALARFETSPLDKVVLARVCEVVRAARIEIVPALERLLLRYPECYTFLFEPRPHHAFFGATPELLVQVEGKAFESMGLAGSIQRGNTRQEDARLADALLNSAKDRMEHDLVVEAMRARLSPVVQELKIPPAPEVYCLSNIQHLHTPVSGVLARADGVLPLVDLLHPTPALGGAPRELALPFIREVEPVPRGWYAAPVGWVDAQLDGVFGVAIRSAVVQERRAWLYAGAGIVAESMPKQEWIETGWKFRPMLQALEIEQEVSHHPHRSSEAL